MVCTYLVRVVDFAVGTAFKQEPSKTKNGENEFLGARSEMVELEVRDLVLAQCVLEDEVEAIERSSPMVQITTWPRPLQHAVQHIGQILIGGRLDTLDQLCNVRQLEKTKQANKQTGSVLSDIQREREPQDDAG